MAELEPRPELAIEVVQRGGRNHGSRVTVAVTPRDRFLLTDPNGEWFELAYLHPGAVRIYLTVGERALDWSQFPEAQRPAGITQAVAAWQYAWQAILNALHTGGQRHLASAGRAVSLAPARATPTLSGTPIADALAWGDQVRGVLLALGTAGAAGPLAGRPDPRGAGPHRRTATVTQGGVGP